MSKVRLAVLLVASATQILTPASPSRAQAESLACPELPRLTLRSGVAVPVPDGFDTVCIFDTGAKAAADCHPVTGVWVPTAAEWDQAYELKGRERPEQFVLRWQKSADSASGCTQQFYAPNPGVTRVRCVSDECHGAGQSAGLGQDVSIEIYDLNVWLEGAKAVGQDKKDLVPFIDGIPLRGLNPENPNARDDTTTSGGEQTRQSLRFHLESRDTNRDNWSRLLNRPVFSRRVTVSVGFPDGDPMPTWVTATADGEDSEFSLVIIRKGWAAVALAVLLVAIAAFLYLMTRFEIVRDANAPLQPDGSSPWSLARLQMAFWFFLVIVSYFILFLIIHSSDTITASVLTLIGISAGTALGSAIIDAGSFSARERYRDVLVDANGKLPPRALDGIKLALDTEMSSLRELRLAAAQGALNTEAQEEAAQRIKGLERQRRFLEQRPWKNFLYNVLGDDGSISFHRFQIAVWTLVLGVVFVNRVVLTLSMPDFSATVLGLMGISAGTYVGFKLPPTNIK